MTSSDPNLKPSEPVEDESHSLVGDDIDAVVHSFENRLAAGELPEIESIINGWEEPEKSKLLYELLSVELRLQSSRDHAADEQQYLDRFADHADVVHDAFAATSLATVAVGLEKQLRTESVIQNLSFLAQGGLGQVYVGTDANLKREAAIKMIHSGLAKRPDSCEQFRIEAEVTGRLEHPGIPTVYAIGTNEEGRLYYAMQYVRGTSLESVIREHHRTFTGDSKRPSQLKRMMRLTHRSSGSQSTGDQSSNNRTTGNRTTGSDVSDCPALDLRELLQIFISVCHTIGYAHRRGILHRDIKPSNIIHGRFGETMVIDWGLALPVSRQGLFKDEAEKTLNLDSSKSSRASSGFAGTPAFMSPEQAVGNIPLTPASDVFSLGATLYYILAGHPPYTGSSAREARQRAIGCDFDPLDRLCPDLPVELVAICHHAMRRSPSDRYQTTGQMVDDLNNYLSDRPIQVLPDQPISRIARWVRHHSQQVMLAMSALLIMAAGIATYAMYERLEANRQELSAASADGMRQQELKLRQDGLRMAADLAARTLSNKVDLFYRILEAEALEEPLYRPLQQYNDAADAQTRDSFAAAIQTRLEAIQKDYYDPNQIRSWMVLAHDGTAVARAPKFDGIGRNFAFRDYYHGLGTDVPPQSWKSAPLTKPHNSTAIFSTVDGAPCVAFSVPIIDPSSHAAIGVIAVFVDCGKFVDLKVQQPEQQRLLLVEGRTYPLIPIVWDEEAQAHDVTGPSKWSAGVVLHHDDLQTRANQQSLPRVGESIISRMHETMARTSEAQPIPTDLRYRDPLDNRADDSNRWIAAYAPVVVESRAADTSVAKTGWFVVVQQEMVSGDD